MNKILQKFVGIGLIMSILITKAAMEEINLLPNGNFEAGIRGWTSYGTGTIDTSVYYRGDNSVRLEGDPNETRNQIRSGMIPVTGDEPYTLTFYSKNEVYTGAVNVGLRWVDQTGQISLRYDWIRLDNDTGWEKYTNTVLPPGGASSVIVLMQLGADALGVAWFDEFSLIQGSISDEGVGGSGPLGFRGSLLSEVSYTPEEKWVAGNRIQLYTDIAHGTQNKVYLHLGGWMPRQNEFQSFSDKSYRNANLLIKRSYLEIDGPWFEGMPYMRTTFGDLTLKYSPYILQLDRWDLWYWDVIDKTNDPASYNVSKRGIATEILESDSLYSSGFLLWETDPLEYAYGGKAVMGPEGKNVGLTVAHYVNRKGVPDGDKPKAEDLTYSYEGVYTAGALKLDLQKITHRHVAENESKANAVLVNIDYNASNFAGFKYQFWNLDSNFDPRYRDRTPCYDPYTGEKLPWNPVDRFRGQKGHGLGLEANKGIIKIGFEGRKAIQERDNVIEINNLEASFNLNHRRLTCGIRGEYEGSEVLKGDEISHSSDLLRLFTSSSYILKDTEQYLLCLEGNYRIDKHDSSASKKTNVLLSSKIKKGPLVGARFFFGWRLIDNSTEIFNGLTCGTDLLLANSINLKIRYANPSETKQLDSNNRLPSYDAYGEPTIVDNIVKLSVGIDF